LVITEKQEDKKWQFDKLNHAEKHGYGSDQNLLGGVQNLPILPPKSGDFGLRA
jgi:hypothetical protein